MKLIVSSSNKDKLKEIKKILGDDYDVITKDEIGLGDLEVVEDGKSLKENAYKKAIAVYERKGGNVIADDTGLFVDALGGQPGIHAARYAGDGCSYQDNVDKMLKELEDVEDMEDRTASFRTDICLIEEDGKVHYIEGKLDGYIGFEERGENGFGYDPIFRPKGSDKTLGQMTDEEKNQISHRRNALENLKNYLKDLR